MGGQDDTKNLILAVALSALVLIGWYIMFPPEIPEPPAPAAQQGAAGQQQAGQTGGTQATGAIEPVVAVDRETALQGVERIAIETPALTGSLALKGGRLDDLHLSKYRETLDPEADTVVLLNPTAAPEPYYVVYGWLRTNTGSPGELPGPGTPWEIEKGEKLTPDTPVTLKWENGSGLTFRRTIEVDERYMFTITQSVQNATDAAVDLAPYGYVARRGMPDTQGMWILHEGAVGVFDEELSEVDYDDMLELDPNSLEGGRVQAIAVNGAGWLGFTDKYWMTTLVAQRGQPFDAIYKAIPGPRPEFRTEMRLPVVNIAPGTSTETTTRVFAGAKEVTTIRDYEETLDILKFEDAVDWGWFYFLTKPLFTLLHYFFILVGNMGWAIILLTLCVKAVLFPLAYKSYVSMSKMKGLQPEMEKLKERCGDDKQRMQKEMMALYKKEKVNPASGCLPIFLQIPIFFSLYKVLFVTIEMRHAPFVGWIKDLSAPDPSSWMTLFGAFPWEIPLILSIFSIGVYPILMGVTMWLQQKLNPAPTDPTQQMIFAWMPWVFMFMLGQFAAGLVIYWTANNVITILQQYFIMRSQGVEVDLLGNIKKSFKRKKEEPATAAASTGSGDTPASKTKPATPAAKPANTNRKRRKGKSGGESGISGGGDAAPPKGKSKKDGNGSDGSGDSGGDGGGGGGGGDG